MIRLIWIFCFAWVMCCHSITANGQVSNKLGAIQQWELSGSMAVRQAKEGWHATIHWWQFGKKNYQIRLFGPVGSGGIYLKQNGNHVELKDGQKTIRAKDAGQLLAKHTGLNLSVDNLFYWAQGLPAPGKVEELQRDEGSGRIQRLRQNGYTIEYTRYMKVGNRILPSFIRVEKNDLLMKLNIRQWKI